MWEGTGDTYKDTYKNFFKKIQGYAAQISKLKTTKLDIIVGYN
jgi:hypothetical protein